jgi:hypothetical protein
MAKEKGHVNINPRSTDFGMNFGEYISPFGTVYFKTHPLFTQHPEWRHWILLLDVKGLYYRYISGRDTQVLTNRQSPGDDQRVDEWFNESGLEIHHAHAHYLIKNVACYDESNACISDSSDTSGGAGA